MDLILLFLLNTIFIGMSNAYIEMVVPDHKNVFDLNLYEEVLNPELCRHHSILIQNNSMLLNQFRDAGPRTPRGILKGNLLDLGNYYQCLDINEHVQNTNIEGKYCMISLPLNQDINWPGIEWPEIPWPNITWPELPWPEIDANTSRLSKETVEKVKHYNFLKLQLQRLIGSSSQMSRSAAISSVDLTLKLALCVPKSCTTKEALDFLLFDLEDVGLEYSDEYCRLPRDKHWVPADYVAVVIFTIIIVLTLVSTFYDLRQTVVLKTNPKDVSKLYQSFSVYTNTKRLLTYKPVPGALECLDGIRSLAMLWVILGHTFVNQLSGNMANPLDALDWMASFWSLWVTSATITVDTFFFISGLLIVYTTVGKLTRSKFIKSIHLFYLNRLLRLFPILAAVILLQASLFNWVTDGPSWELVAEHTHRCRVYWWPTLLYIQNFYNPASICLPHSWYLAIDFHMFLLSPLILYWVIGGRRKTAWIALCAGLLASLVGSTIYNFIKDFPSATITLSRPQDQSDYMLYYYVNTLTRASPFFVGMIFGYLLHVYRGKKVVIPKMQVILLWFVATGLSIAVTCTTYPIIQANWANQTADNFINSFMRPIWALTIGWMVFACTHGYGGPINWVLSLRMWKITGRLSYAMYIIHYPLIYVVNSTVLAPIYFSSEFSMHRFCVDVVIAILAAFVVTILVDSPCSTLIKMFMGGSKRPARPAQDISEKKDIDIVISPPLDSNKVTIKL